MLISVTDCQKLLLNPNVIVFDCRFDLTDPSAGQHAYNQKHLPGAIYADLKIHLSGPATGRNGRHPLPDPHTFLTWLGQQGVNRNTSLIAYDANDGLYASRLWWLCQWVGLNCTVLDGGLAQWAAAEFPTTSKIPAIIPANASDMETLLALRPDRERLVSLAELDVLLGQPATYLIDARAPERYRGEVEPLDAKPGHIPSAHNYPYKRHLQANGCFLPKRELQSVLANMLAERRPEQLIASCGSGVTACHVLLALEVAGLGGGRLYPGSYSEWTQDPTRPVATGDSPI